ncbi:MAG: resolvase [Phycisphaerae bacterium]|nr:resolvase [Phycisphaerae bacterium]
MASKGKRIKVAGDKRIAVAYLRVSTEDQALGPEAQRAAVERWAAARGVTVAAWFCDQGVSGAAPIDRRPELLAALAALPAHGAALLVVAKRDRLARDTMIAAMVERMAADVGATVTSAAGEGEGDGPEALLMRRLVDAFAEYERALIAARTRAALAVKSARGERVGAVPLGMRLADDGRTLALDADEARAVELVRELRGAGWTLRAIAADLDARGLRSRTGRPWHPQQVARMVG